MKQRLIDMGRRIVHLATATPRRAATARYVVSLGFVAAVFSLVPQTPLEGPAGGVIALASVAVCCWFCGPGPALLMPTVIWIVSRLDEPEPTAALIPTARQLATCVSLSMLTGAVGLAGQYRRRLEAVTEHHSARMREYLQALSRARIIFRNLDGRIAAWNEGAQQLYGWTTAEAAGRPIHELLHTQFPVPLPQIRDQLSASGQWQGEITQRRKDGAELFVAVHFILYAGDNGSQAIIAEIHNDVTKLRRAEAAIRDSDRRKDLFVATLAHELRNPLAPLRSGLDVLRMLHRKSPDEAAILEIMQRQLDHIVRMVDDLLDVSRINTGKIELRRARVQLADIIRDAVETCRPQIAATQHDLQIAVPAEPITLHADAARLVQVVVNLLSNAAKFTPAGGRIRLTAHRAGDEVTVCVADNGVGIQAAALPRIFDVFAQVEEVHRRSAGGLGLGLNIVRTFVEMHGGTISVHSDGPGRGAEFTVRLPAAGVVPVGPAKSDPADSIATGPTSHRILVVDDNQDAARTLALMLNKIGFECRSAFDGPSALTLAGEFDPHAIVLDLGMPDMDGLEVAQHLRTPPQSSKALLIALTGWDKEDDRRNTRAAGFDHHLAKPVQLDTLKQVLQTLNTTTAPQPVAAGAPQRSSSA